MMKTYQFNYRNAYAGDGIALALKKTLSGRSPVIVCIGSDLVSGDSLGPTTGTMLQESDTGTIIIGSLNLPVTAKEIKYLKPLLYATFPRRPVVVVDAAVGNSDEVGMIRLSDAPLRPGSGVQKDLGNIGDVSIQGIVAERGLVTWNTLKEVRMNMVYRMAKYISEGIKRYQNTIC